MSDAITDEETELGSIAKLTIAFYNLSVAITIESFCRRTGSQVWMQVA